MIQNDCLCFKKFNNKRKGKHSPREFCGSKQKGLLHYDLIPDCIIEYPKGKV